MANIDVSELMSDPDFVDPVTLITRIPRVDYLGQVTFTEVITQTYGSVQPADYRTIQKLPDAMRVANVSEFWVKAEIVASEPGKYSSVLVFRGKRYQVQTVAEWSNFGQGFSDGTCVQETPA